MMEGYHKHPEWSVGVLEDGWLASGDIGQIGPDGDLYVIDRVKQLVKLSQGEYLSLTKLNDTYTQAKGVCNIFVFANSLHDHPVAIVVPTTQQIENWKKEGISDFKTSPKAKADVLTSLDECHRTYELSGIERIKKVHLDDMEFTIDNGLMTPSMKPHFHQLTKKFAVQLKELYGDS
jgi:long-chain acyl-CoA synthetase